MLPAPPPPPPLCFVVRCFVQTVLGKGHKIKNFKLLDFSAIRAHLDTAKQIKLAATDGEKASAKMTREELTVSQ